MKTYLTESGEYFHFHRISKEISIEELTIKYDLIEGYYTITEDEDESFNNLVIYIGTLGESENNNNNIVDP